MVNTVENSPSTFHRKNRGIIYVCDKFEFDNKTKTLRITYPRQQAPPGAEELENGEPKFGIADGGHTFEVILQTVARMNELRERGVDIVRVLQPDKVSAVSWSNWWKRSTPRRKCSSSRSTNTRTNSRNLKQHSMAEGFDPDLVAFRENEDKEWDVREIVQRLETFPQRPVENHAALIDVPIKKAKPSQNLYTNDATHEEFVRLFDVAADIVTLPEFIQSEFSKDTGKGRKFGKLRGVKCSRRPTPAGTVHDGSRNGLGGIVADCRRLPRTPRTQGNRYYWKVNYKEVFRVASEELYKTLLAKVRTAKAVNSLGSDTEYWTQCSNIVLRAKYEVLNA